MFDEGKQILIVDDSHSFIDSMIEIIGDDDNTIFTAYTATEALEMAEKHKPFIIFLDIVLPDGEGYEVCSKIKRKLTNRPMQIVLMSANEECYKLDKILSTGADDFIKKPIEPMELKLRLKAAQIRLFEQIKLVKEREYFRLAVHNEEQLNSRLLDNHVNLKETLDILKSKKQSLEEENEHLTTVATIDTLTGLLNRYSLDSRLHLEVRRASELSIPLAGLMMDVNNFKSINDNYGHVAGDIVLREVGQRLKSCLRKEDIAGRYGGDEFFVILPETEITTNSAFFERLKDEIGDLFINIGVKEIEVTSSIGVSQYRNGDSVNDWINRADDAMYESKREFNLHGESI